MRLSVLFTLLQSFPAIASNVSTFNISRFFDVSAASDLNKSPFRVHLEHSAELGSVQAVVRNNGEEDAYFQASAFLPGRGIQLYNVRDQPVQVHTRRNRHTEPVEFQKISAGNYLKLEVDLASTFTLQRDEQYYIQAAGFVPYYLESQQREASKDQSALFEAPVVPFRALESQVQPIVKIQQVNRSRQLRLIPCTDPVMQTKMIEGIASALKQSKLAIDYVENGVDRSIMITFFKKDDPRTRKLVSERMKAIVSALEFKSGGGLLECEGGDGSTAAQNAAGFCKKSGAMALAEAKSGRITMCNVSKPYPADFRRCSDGNWGGTIVHELTHSNPIYAPHTIDVAYRLSQVKSLTHKRALQNAQTFNYLVYSTSQKRSC